MKKTKYLILGAGISGLFFANRLGDEDFIILEKEREAGGYCKTIRKNDFVWDYAGHFFHFSHAETKDLFLNLLESEDVVTRQKNTKIFYNGQYIDYPFQKNIHQLPKEEMIDCLYDLFAKKEEKQYGSFLDMLYGKFGRSITEKFLKPYNEKLYACDLNLLDVDAMGRFFPYADKNEIIRNMKDKDNSSYNNSFIYPKQGAMVFIEELLKCIDKKRIRYNEEAIEIDIDKKTLKTNQDTYYYEHLISSVPLNKFSILTQKRLIADNALSYNKVLVLNLGFDMDAIDKDIHWIYVPSKDINFYRAGYYSNIIGSNKLSMYIEIGYPMEATISETEIEIQLEKTLYNLKQMGIITDHRLVDYEPVIMDPAYVHITRKSIQDVELLKASLKDSDIHLLGRYSNWKYCSIEDCMIDAIEVLEGIRGDAS